MKDQTQELIKKLEEGVKNVMDSESFKDYLKFQSSFHNYSFNNVILIMLQNPAASMVAGFKSWEKLGRHVKRGEKGLRILAPSIYKKTIEVDLIDPKTNKPKVNDKGEALTEKKEIQKLSFRDVAVFDVSQTDGKELPTVCKLLQGDSKEAERIIKAIKEFCEIPIIEEDITNGAKGYFSRDRGIIAVKTGMSLEQTAKTLIHEYAHYKLHNVDNPLLDRATKEVQAESTAFVVSNRFGVDTSSYSFEYVAAWSGDKELQELKDSLQVIQKASCEIIDKIQASIEKQLEVEKNFEVKVHIVGGDDPILSKGQSFSFADAEKLFEERNKEHSRAMEIGNKDIKEVTAENHHNYVPYHKVRFTVELPNGIEFGAKMSMGGGSGSIVQCLLEEYAFDIKSYMKELAVDKTTNITPLVHDKHVLHSFYKEFPALKHLSKGATETLMSIANETNISSIRELKANYKALGKQLETSNDPKVLEKFNRHGSMIDELKSCVLKDAKEKASLSNMTKNVKNSNLEMGM